MSEDFPGFIEDEQKPKAKPGAPPQAKPPATRPAPAAPAKLAKPAKPAKPAPPPPAEDDHPGFIEDEPKEEDAAPAGDAPPAFDPFAGSPGGGSAAAEAEAEANVKPGAGKDLWACPHCGARNKPDRSTCRSCGKGPDDEVIVPWHQEPKNRLLIAGGAGGVVLLILLLTMIGGGPKLKPPGPRGVDSRPHISGSSNINRDLGNERHFVGNKRFAVSGRVVGGQNTGESLVIVLALGKDATEDAAFTSYHADFASPDDPVIRPEPRSCIVLHTLYAGDERPNVEPGRWLSLIGVSGLIEMSGGGGALGENHYVVQVEQFDQE